MGLNLEKARECLKQFDLRRLFVRELGWDNLNESPAVMVDDHAVKLAPVAHKRSFAVFEVPTPAGQHLPDSGTRKKVERQVARLHHEHLLVFTDAAKSTQVWHWAKREGGKQVATREHTWTTAQHGDALLQKLNRLVVALAEEEELTLAAVGGKVAAGFDVDRVTKKFYDRFKAEHQAFLSFIKGIKAQGDAEWYASLMLNRLMFVYFIQRKGFLDGDVHYLRTKLRQMQLARGKDKFLNFYRHFLLRLFHEGLGSDQHSAELDALLGKVPFLNGGLFDMHQLEAGEAGQAIAIKDEAFEKLFDFFDGYQWHLDERPLRADNEINPDVLGYIFEKYINQKQMGAYYTKEDITEYIGKNTIVPWLLDAARERCDIAFRPDGELWRLLRDDPDRYLYPAVRKGVIEEAGVVIPLPTAIAAGVDDVSKRGGWNKPAAAPYALPTETWREHVARRTRCLELRLKLAAGEIHSANDLITWNLDIRQFAQDAIDQCEGPDLLWAFWTALTGVSVLDPTCGSGAFLFAALNILEPLYDACLERMRALLEDRESAGKRASGGGKETKTFAEFRQVLDQVAKHANRRYFILKSIVVGNLYGVDIMEEAVEICKLRLFLKLVAQLERADQIEPLPDIDFNIRAGNTLVGYPSIEAVRESHRARYPGLPVPDEINKLEAQARSFADNYAAFCRAQTNGAGGKSADLAAAKGTLRKLQAGLSGRLDRYLAGDYGIEADDAKNEAKFQKWRSSHQPFHWGSEFYGIMGRGGFDVVIGNPPYVDVPKELARDSIRRIYRTVLDRWSRDEDLYTLVVERGFQIQNASCGRFGMILPLSFAFSTKRPFQELRRYVLGMVGSWWWSHFDRIPCALFGNEVRTRCTVAVFGPTIGRDIIRATTALNRWTTERRESLFPMLTYAQFAAALEMVSGILKVGSQLQADAITALLRRESTLEVDLSTTLPFSKLAAAAPRFPQPCVFVGGTAYNWFPVWRDIPETTDEDGRPSLPARTAAYQFADEQEANAVFAILASALGYWWWAVGSDGFNLKKWLLDRFPLSVQSLSKDARNDLAGLGGRLRRELRKHYVFKDNKGRIGNFFLPACEELTREIDLAIARHLPFLGDAFFEDIRTFNASFSRAAVNDDQDDEVGA